MPTINISDNKLVENYATQAGAILGIDSVVHDAALSVRFAAFLTNFTQTFDATWNTEDVFGRMDPIATYQGTKRSVSLAFDVPSASPEDAKNNLIKTQDLVKMVYPVYNDIDGASILSKPPLVRVFFANLLKNNITGAGSTSLENNGPLGWISGLSWNPEIIMGMFSVNGEFYPKVIKISFEFNILHESTLGQTEPSLNRWPFGVE